MTRHSTIIAGRGARKRAVRVERKRRGVGVSAVGDALFRLGGALSGADVLRILTERKPDRPIGKPKPTVCQAEPAFVETPAPDPSTSLLADDVCRHVHQGWFGRALWLGGVL